MTKGKESAIVPVKQNKKEKLKKKRKTGTQGVIVLLFFMPGKYVRLLVDRW